MPRAPAVDESRTRSQTGGPDLGAPFYESEGATKGGGGDGESMYSVNASNRNSSEDKRDSGNLGTPYLGSSPPLTRQTLMKKKSSLMLDGGGSPAQSALKSSHQGSSRKSGRTNLVLDDVLEDDATTAAGGGAYKGTTSVLEVVSKFKERSGKRISTLDQHTMSPFAKFRHYGRFPCKLVLNILIFSLLLFIIVAYELPSSTADESERKVLQLHFINAVIGDSDTEALMPGGDFYVDEPIIYLFERSEVLGAIERVMETYYSLAAISLNDFDVLFNDKGPYGWVPPSQNLSASTPSQHIISPTSDAGQQIITPDVTGTVNVKDGSSEATLSKRVQRAKDFIGGSQMKYISNRKTFYTAEKPPPPPSLSTTLHHMFEGATSTHVTANSDNNDNDDGATSTSASVISTLHEGHESYFDYVRSLYESHNISDPNEIQNSWMLQPIMEIYMLSCSARVDWRVETNEMITRSFYLARDAPLGPFRTDEAALEGDDDDDADDADDPLSFKRSSARTSLPPPPPSVRDEDPSYSNPFWLDFVCGPRPDPFFTGDYYLPCRLTLDADGDAENVTDDGLQGATKRKAFGAQGAPSKKLPRGRRASRPAVAPATATAKKSHRNNIKQKNEKKTGQKKRRTVFGAMPKPNRRMMRTAATSPSTVAAPAEPDYHALTPMGIFDQVQRITIQLQIQQVCSSINDKQETLIGLFYRDALYYWSISVVFETDLNGRVMVTFPVSFEERRGYEHLYVTFFAILFLGGFSLWDLALRVRAIQRIFRFRHMLRKKMKHHLKLLEEERIREEEEHNAAALAAFFDGGGFYTGNVPEKSTTSIPRVGSKGSMFGSGSDGVGGSLGMKGASSDEVSALWPRPEGDGGGSEEALLQGRQGRSSSPSSPYSVESVWKNVKRIARGEKLRKAQKSAGAAPSVGHLQGAHLHNPHSTDDGSLYSAVIRPEVRASNLSHGDLYSSANLQSQGPPQSSIAMVSNVDNDGQYTSFNTTSPTVKPISSPFGNDTAKFRKKWKKSLHADMGMSWHIWSILSSTLNIVYVCYTTALALQIGASIESSRTLRVVLGLSAMGSTALFVSYLRFFPNLYFMIRATSGSVTRLISFLIGVFPIYIGYALFFTTVSGSVSTGMYLTVFRSFVSLSAAWFGDNLLPDFAAASDSEFLHIHIVATFMLFSFIAVAMYCVLNLFLAIVSDSYMEIRRRYGLTIAPQDWYKQTAVAKKAAAEGADGGRKGRKNRRASMGPIAKRKGLLVTTAKQRMRNDALREVRRQLELLATTFDSSDEDDAQLQETVKQPRPQKVKKNKNKKSKKVASKPGSLEASGNDPQYASQQEVGVTEDGLAMTIPIINVNAPLGGSAHSLDGNANLNQTTSSSRLQREYSEEDEDEDDGSGGEQSPLLGDAANNNQSSGNFDDDDDDDDDDESDTDEESEQRAELRDAYGGLLSEPGLDLRIFEEFERTKSRSRFNRTGSFNGGGSFTGTSQSRLLAATGSRAATSVNFHASVGSRAQSVRNFLTVSGSHGSNAPAGGSQATTNLLLRPTRGAIERIQSADVTASRSAPTVSINQAEESADVAIRPMPSSASAANFGSYMPLTIRTVRSRSVLASDSDYTSSSYDTEDSDYEASD